MAVADNRRRSVRPRQALLWALLSLALAATLPGVTASPAQSRSERTRIARQQFEQARELHAALDDKSSEAEHLRVANLYRRVYNIAPFSGLSADALAARAALFHDMGNRFGRSHFEKSIEVYEFLRKEYPHSEYRAKALFEIGKIYQDHLHDDAAARKTYEELLQSYPDSDLASDARKALRTLERAQAAQREAEEEREARLTATAATQDPVEPPAGQVRVENIRYWNTKGYTRVVFDLDGEVKYQGARLSNPDRIFFDLFHAQLSDTLRNRALEINGGLLGSIRVAENRSGVTRIVLEVNGAKDYSVFTLPNPYRLVIDIRADEIPPAPSRRLLASNAASSSPRSGSKPPAAKPSVSQPDSSPAEPVCSPAIESASQPKPGSNGITLTRALGLKVSRIVIDPGHGGADPGTKGPTGLVEKDLTLEVARRLAKRLEKELCAEVVLTRDSDVFIPLEARTALANEKKADLFVSIHANYSRSRGVRGVETYYLNFTSDPEALEVAARENALTQQSVHDLQDIIKKISRNEKIMESRELAESVQDGVSDRLRRYSRSIRNRGVRKAPFVVLLGANMPSVLSEISFISNRSDEKHLMTSDGKDRVVEGLFNGITEYLKNLNGLSVAQATN